MLKASLKLFFFLGIGLFTGCASTTPQSSALYRERSFLKPQAQIENIKFINQEAGHCGPATLAMSLQSIGHQVSLAEITQQVYTPNNNGSLQADMISAARRQGKMAVTISGFNALLTELQEGRAVIIFENLGISWIPQWHYALVTGYNLEQKKLTLNSGPNENEKIDMSEFELSWKLTQYWGLVVMNPGEIANAADELAHLESASALEEIGKLAEAEKSYSAILNKWPQSLTAYIGLGNITYKNKDYKKSVEYLKKARELFPTSEVVQHNLAIAEKARKQKSKN